MTSPVGIKLRIKLDKWVREYPGVYRLLVHLENLLAYPEHSLSKHNSDLGTIYCMDPEAN